MARRTNAQIYFNPSINKKAYKKNEGCCKICDESEYSTLHAHRINPGSEGGSYRRLNTVVACANCHAKIHNGLIKIDRWYPSTSGPVLHFWDENGEEHFK
jgi:hypothetical protein